MAYGTDHPGSNNDGRWRDIFCDASGLGTYIPYAVLCNQPPPTSSPTTLPTRTPSDQPTATPTQAPTYYPTNVCS